MAVLPVLHISLEVVTPLASDIAIKASTTVVVEARCAMAATRIWLVLQTSRARSTRRALAVGLVRRGRGLLSMGVTFRN